MRIREALARDLVATARRVSQARGWVEPPRLHLEVPGQPDFGDLTCNLPLAWSRSTGCPPRELAEALLERLPERPWWREVQVQGPGFLNFSLSETGLRLTIHDVLRRGSGCLQTREGRGLEIPAPRLPRPPQTPAEGRLAALWEARAGLLESTGARVLRQDRGTEGLPPLRLVGRPADRLWTFPGLLQAFGGPVLGFLMLDRPEALDLDQADDPTLANPARKVLYACTRTRGLRKMATDQGLDPNRPLTRVDLEALGGPREFALARALEEFPWATARAATQARPDLLTRKAVDLAELFHLYFNHERILGAPAPVTRARVALARAVQEALEAAWAVLGLRFPESDA